MPIEGRCPQCQQAYCVPDQLAGTPCRCNACGAVVVVPQHPLAPPQPLASRPISAPQSHAASDSSFDLLWKDGRPTIPAIAIGIALVTVFLGIALLEVARRVAFRPADNSASPEAPAPETQTPEHVPAASNSETQHSQQPQPTSSTAANSTPDPVVPPASFRPEIRRFTVVGVYRFDGVYAGREPIQQALRRAFEKMPWAVADSLTYDATRKRYEVLSTNRDLRGQRPIREQLADVGFRLQNGEAEYFPSPETREVASLAKLPPAPPPIGADEPPLQLPATPQTFTAAGSYSFEINQYQGTIEFHRALRGALRQVPGVLVESVDYDPANKMVSFFSTQSHRELSNQLFILGKLREAGFIMGGRSQQQHKLLTVTIGPRGVSPLARDASQHNYMPPTPTTVVPTVPAIAQAGSAIPLREPSAWQLQADPGPTRTGTPRSIKLPPNHTAVRNIHFADPPVERALIPTDIPPGTVLAYDTGTGQQIGTAVLDTTRLGMGIVLSKEKLLGYSPDGTLALTYEDDLDELRVVSWQKGQRSTLSAFQLNPAESFEAFFVTNTRVALVRKNVDKNTLTIWALEGKPPIVYDLGDWSQSADLQAIRSSPGRRFFALVGYHAVHLFHSESGAVVGKIDFPTAQNYPWIYGATFSPDGKLLVLFTGEERGKGSGCILFPFETATGKALPQIYMSAGRSRDPTFHWQGSRFLTIGPATKMGDRQGFSLIDLQQSAEAINYFLPQGDWSTSFTKQSDPAGTIWLYSSALSSDNIPDFTPLILPRYADLMEIDQSLAKRPIVLQPTEEVAVEVKLETPSPIANFREQVEQRITKKLTEQGRRVSPSAAKRLVVTIKQITLDGTITVPIHYKLAGFAPQREEVTIGNHPVEISFQLLDASGQPSWKFETGYNPMFAIASEDTPNEMCKERPQQAAETYRWVRVKQFFQWYAVPSPLFPAAEIPNKEIRVSEYGAVR